MIIMLIFHLETLRRRHLCRVTSVVLSLDLTRPNEMQETIETILNEVQKHVQVGDRSRRSVHSIMIEKLMR